jgi:hypothetical protein
VQKIYRHSFVPKFNWTKDLEAVRFLSTLPRAVCARNPSGISVDNGNPTVTTMNHADGAIDPLVFARKIRKELSYNRPVVVKGWSPQAAMNFTVADFEKQGFVLQQPVQYQGMRL